MHINYDLFNSMLNHKSSNCVGITATSTALLLERLKKRELDRFEREDGEFFKRVADGFSQMAAQDPQRWLIIDGTPAKDDLEKIISAAVSERLGI